MKLIKTLKYRKEREIGPSEYKLYTSRVNLFILRIYFSNPTV